MFAQYAFLSRLPRAMLKLDTILAELRTIEEWDRRFQPLDNLDEIGLECRRRRKKELLIAVAVLVSMN